MSISKVNLQQKFDSFSEHWNPKIVAELNGQLVKVAKLQGEFVMHQHDDEDEMFLVSKGILNIELEDQTLELHPGEFVVIPKGTPHKPIANDEVELILFEPASTVNTGATKNELTVEKLDRI